jgi:hypothetical protein
MDDPNLDAVLNNESIGTLLGPDDRKPLSNFIYHLKIKRRRLEEEEKKRIEHGNLTSEKGKSFVN